MHRLALVLLIGCSRFDKGAGHVVMPDVEAVVVGAPLEVVTSWTRQCHENFCDGGNHDGAGPDCHPIVVACKPLPYELEIHCSGPSASDCPSGRHPSPPTTKDKLTTTTVVRPTQLGALIVEVTLVHETTPKVERRQYIVASPEDLELTKTVEAATGRVTIYGLLKGKRSEAGVMRINGQPVVGPTIELAKLFPDRVAGAGVQPGSYELAIEIGELARTVTVDATIQPTSR